MAIRVYFAHSMRDYGTLKEARALKRLRRVFPGLVCPNTDLRLGSDMSAYTDYVEKCTDMVVILEHEGFIGKGVFLELKVAKRCNIPILVYRDNHLIPVVDAEVYDTDDWKVYHALLITL